MRKIAFILFLVLLSLTDTFAQYSVARIWNEAMLEAIRNDLARPTVHARNLYHVSLAMYDAWAVFDQKAEPIVLGRVFDEGYYIPFEGFSTMIPTREARHEAISFAAYRILSYRFSFSPSFAESQLHFDSLMQSFGYDQNFEDVDYRSGNPAALGNYIADQLLAYGINDGSNELNDFRNRNYLPFNPPLIPDDPGNPDIVDPNRWQELALDIFIDQSGNILADGTSFLSAEWGDVRPFALDRSLISEYTRDNYTYKVYLDPGAPPYMNPADPEDNSDLYKWNFELVSIWASHLDPDDSVMIDISPGARGNIQEYPVELSQHPEFYGFFDGGDPGEGHAINPHTGQPYEANIVPRGDFARVIAEFWADGPDSETPPGHWFKLLNYVSDHPELVKKFKGEGEVLSDLEWDIKSYMVLGAGMHDAAIVAWSIKGWYDYIRPISAIRYLADQGQSSDPESPNYDPNGIRLYPGYIELVDPEDSLAGISGENVNKIKLYTWRGHEYIEDSTVDEAGVGWILAENWWPYQRPSFVTPPFAGYVSGHSTFSRTAAELLTKITGSPYFPGGLGEFVAKKNEFLVFEDGPSQDVVLQWATYADASDETSLSRIWGGIHPPADDIPGRLLGIEVADYTFEKASRFFEGTAFITGSPQISTKKVTIYPTPIAKGETMRVEVNSPRQILPGSTRFSLLDLTGSKVAELDAQAIAPGSFDVHIPAVRSGLYLLRIGKASLVKKIIIK